MASGVSTTGGPATLGGSGRRRPGRRRGLLLKLAVAVGALATLGFLFMRSVRDSQSTPYVIPAGAMRGWTLALHAAEEPTDPVLLLRPPPQLANSLFGQVFKRIMESMMPPAIPAIPLLLQREFNDAFGGRVRPEELLAAAQRAGLDSAAFKPLCLAHRRVSDARATQQLYFVLFEAPAFTGFRQQLATMSGGGGSPGAGGNDPSAPSRRATGDLDAAALSPVLFIAVSGSTFSRWLPLRADPASDCVAPISVGKPPPG